MNKGELIKAIATKAGFTQKDATAAYDAFIASVTEALKAGDKVQLVGFGTFEVKKKAERITFNPGTKQRMLIPPKLVLSYKPSNVLKEKIQNNQPTLEDHE